VELDCLADELENFITGLTDSNATGQVRHMRAPIRLSSLDHHHVPHGTHLISSSPPFPIIGVAMLMKDSDDRAACSREDEIDGERKSMNQAPTDSMADVGEL
jgi:hypothetical protein